MIFFFILYPKATKVLEFVFLVKCDVFSPLYIIKKGEEKVLAAIMHPLDNTIRTEPHTKLNSLKIR